MREKRMSVVIIVWIRKGVVKNITRIIRELRNLLKRHVSFPNKATNKRKTQSGIYKQGSRALGTGTLPGSNGPAILIFAMKFTFS